jgi:hypothetical protein
MMSTMYEIRIMVAGNHPKYVSVTCDDVLYAMDVADIVSKELDTAVYVIEYEDVKPTTWLDIDVVYEVEQLDDAYRERMAKYEKQEKEFFAAPLKWIDASEFHTECHDEAAFDSDEESPLDLVMI